MTPGSEVNKSAVINAKTPTSRDKDVERTPENEEASDFAKASESTLQHTTKGKKTSTETSTAQPKSIKKESKSSNRKKNCGCCLVQ